MSFTADSVASGTEKTTSSGASSELPKATPVKPGAKALQIEPMWCDRFRPRTFEECLMHRSLNESLLTLVHDDAARGEFPHLLICGPPGAGKRTRATCIIADIFRITRSELRAALTVVNTTLPGIGGGQKAEPTLSPHDARIWDRINNVVRNGIVEPVSEEERARTDLCVPVNTTLTRVRNVTCKKKTSIQMLQSPVHVELTPSDVNHCDTRVVQYTLKQLFETNESDSLTFDAIPSLSRFRRAQQAQALSDATPKMHRGAKSENGTAKDSGERKTNPAFRVFVLNDVDKMSREAQTALRRIMEDYSNVARFILIACNVDHVIAPIQSRCQLVAVPKPSDDDVRHVLESALLRAIPEQSMSAEVFAAASPYVDCIVNHVHGNVTKALIMMEASLHAHIDSSESLTKALRDFHVVLPDWLIGVRNCVQQICQVSLDSNSARHVYVKKTLGELLKRCVPIEHLTRCLEEQVRTTLGEQCNLIVDAMKRLLTSDSVELSDAERAFLEHRVVNAQQTLAAVCSDISTAAAWYAVRANKSQFPIIHINALALTLIVIVSLYQNSLAIAQDAALCLRVCRPYSATHVLSRLLRHTNKTSSLCKDRASKLLQTDVAKAHSAHDLSALTAESSLARVDWQSVQRLAAAHHLNTTSLFVEQAEKK